MQRGFRPSSIPRSLPAPASAACDAGIVGNGCRFNPWTVSTLVDFDAVDAHIGHCAIECHGIRRLAQTPASVVVDLQSTDRRLRIQGETPVEQAGGLIPVG